jgi:simple sugar transport system permease protein
MWTAPVGASVIAAVGGLMLSGRLASVAASQGSGAIFTVFAAAVIGSVSLSGGKGTMFGAFTGILLLFMIQNVLTLAGVPAQWIDALNGAIILVALVVSRITGGKAQE